MHEDLSKTTFFFQIPLAHSPRPTEERTTVITPTSHSLPPQLKTISIIGRGIDPEKHLTLQALRALKAADRAFGIEPETATWKKFQKEFGTPVIEDLSFLYRSDRIDQANYEAFVATILQALDSCKHLALLVAGHPMVGVSFIRILRSKLEDRIDSEVKIEIIGGISSFDTLLLDLQLDPLERGTLLLDTNRLLLLEYELDPSLGAFLYHVCSVGNSITDYRNTSSTTRLSLLKHYLLRFFPPHKELFLCRSSFGVDVQSARFSITLAELEQAAEQIDFATTLYIPPEKPRRLNRDFLSLLQNTSGVSS